MTAAITIHFRNPGLTAACIDSLLVDGWAPILVWDNSADDGVTLRTLEARYASDARVQWGHNASNLGFGKGMNAALAKLGGCGYAGPVLLINNDARVEPGMYAALHQPLPMSLVPTLVAPRIVQDGHEQGWLHYQPWLALVTRRPLPGSFAYLSGCCLLVHRSNNAQPLFDEDFFMYGEDVELSWRWSRQGGKLVLLDDVWLQHAGSASSGRASDAYERFIVRSHWLLAEKLATGAPARTFLRALRVPSLLARATLRALRYRSIVPLRAVLQLLDRASSLPTDHEARR
jgi:GT2 family glycosyltransferase